MTVPLTDHVHGRLCLVAVVLHTSVLITFMRHSRSKSSEFQCTLSLSESLKIFLSNIINLFIGKYFQILKFNWLL